MRQHMSNVSLSVGALHMCTNCVPTPSIVTHLLIRKTENIHYQWRDRDKHSSRQCYKGRTDGLSSGERGLVWGHNY